MYENNVIRLLISQNILSIKKLWTGVRSQNYTKCS